MLPCMARTTKPPFPLFSSRLLALTTALVCLSGVPRASEARPDSALGPALDYLHSCQRLDGGFGEHGEASTEGLTLLALSAISAAGESPGRWTTGGESALSYLAAQSTERSPAATGQLILGLEAAGEAPGSFAGIDWEQRLVDSFIEDQFGDPKLLIDDFWALLALAGKPSHQAALSSAGDHIAKHQVQGQGWSWSHELTSDHDNTALALMALHETAHPRANEVGAEGLEWLRTSLSLARDHRTPYYNVPALAMHIQAHDTLAPGQHSDHRTKILSELKGLQLPDGSFSWTPRTSSFPCWNTAAAIPALMGPSAASAGSTSAAAQPPRAKATEQELVPPPTEATISVRIEGAEGLLWEGEVLVEPTDYVLRTGQEGKTDRPTVLGASILALRASGLPFELTGDYGDEIYTVDGKGPYRWFYRLNAEKSDLCQIVQPVTDGDQLILFHGKRDDRALRVRSTGVPEAGETPVLVAEAFDSNTEEWTAAPDAVIAVKPTSVGEQITGYQAQASGVGFIRSEVLRIEAPTPSESPEEDSSSSFALLALLGLLGLLGAGVLLRRASTKSSTN